MSNEIKANEIYTLPDGSMAQWVDGQWVKEERGPLGGVIKRLCDCHSQEIVTWQGQTHILRAIILTDFLVETDIPPRLTGERMTAGEAAKMPGIVERWVAAKVGDTDNSWASLGVAYNGEDHAWFHSDAPVILLPEGFGDEF